MSARRMRAGMPRARRAIVVLLGVMLAGSAVAGIGVTGFGAAGGSTQASPSPSEEDAPPDGWEPFRPLFHLTPERGWINDPQRPVLIDGVWHLWYLYNADYPGENGTAWYLATSDDLVTWNNRGVAIEKYRNGLGDILTGSAVIDREDTAGFGAGTLVALATQQGDGVQRQSLFTSVDGGRSFASYAGNPVMPNPGEPDWRDPKVVRDEARGQWVMVLAEGRRLGFYTSADLRSWRYESDFARAGLGSVECPDLFEMVDPVSGRRTWVLGVSADAAAESGGAGFAYWTGDWNGSTFTADAEQPQWLDRGPDFYAAVTWDDPRDGGRLERRYALAWMNNWAYATRMPGGRWHGGALSVTRELSLREVDGRLRLLSRPVTAGEGQPARQAEMTVSPGAAVPLDIQPSTAAFRLRAEVAGGARIRLGDTGGGGVVVGVDAASGAVFLDRSGDEIADAMPEAYRRRVSAAASTAGGAVALDILVDSASVEVFTADGSASLTAAAFRDPAGRVTVEAVDGPARLTNVSIGPIAVHDPNASERHPSAEPATAKRRPFAHDGDRFFESGAH